jgi:NAD(P)H-hydrate epimerase
MLLVTAEEMREMDRQSIEEIGIPGRLLMENAGRGAAQFFWELFSGPARGGIGVLAGRGNNGGDGFVMARCLAQHGVPVTVYLLAEGATVKGDAAANLQLLHALEIPVVELPDEESFNARRRALRRHGVWIDAILGTGLKSEVTGYFRKVIEFLNRQDQPVFAVDMPSGLNSDTGQICGVCVQAEATATFGCAKIGHLVFPGARLAGLLRVVDIGIPARVIAGVAPRQRLLESRSIRDYFHPRPPESHKGNTGHVMVLAGSPGKTGAAVLTTMAAVRAGAGLVTLGIPEGLNATLETQVLEAMTLPLPQSADGLLAEAACDPFLQVSRSKRCLAVGPGIGQSGPLRRILRRIMTESKLPVVVDADGLNNLVGQLGILKSRSAPTILTPHPGEMARLIGTDAGQVQSDRISCARQFAAEHRTHLILKGARTVIAHPDGQVHVNPTGNPGMASGGMGDVLTGIVAGFLAQGFTPEAACQCAVFLHGAAADRLARSLSPVGFLAGELLAAVPHEIQKMLAPVENQARGAGPGDRPVP